MVEEGRLPTPLSPDQRRQGEIDRAAEERKAQAAELEARLLTERGPEYEKQARALGVDDSHQCGLIVQEAARILAESWTRPGTVHFRDERGAVEEAKANVEQVQDQALRQELEDERAKRSQPQPTPEITSTEQKEAEEARKQQLIENAKALGAKDDVAAASWVAQAETSDRQHHQGGRYDVLKGVPPSNKSSSPRGGSPNDPPPRDPTSPTKAPPSGPTKGPLSANEVLQRFGNPELEARYDQQEQQRRQQQPHTASSTPVTPASLSARGNVPSEKSHEDGLLGSFVTAATKKKAEEERAERANDPSKSLGRGGRGGR